jgi:hypothetical protein
MTGVRSGRWLIAAALACLGPLWTAPATGNGAFPSADSVLLPATQPRTIVLGTTFGLMISEDDGASWSWICEHGLSTDGTAYQTVAAPGSRVIALAIDRMVYTDDLGCSWRQSDPGLPSPGDGIFPFDFFPSPADPRVVLTLASRMIDGQAARVILGSSDGSASMGQVLYTAPAGEGPTTVEIAASQPDVAYATLHPFAGPGHTRFLRSNGAGAAWTVVDPGPVRGGAQLGIAAIDARDPGRLYLRGQPTGVSGDFLGVSADGGANVAVPLTVAGTMTDLLQLADGSLLVASDGPAGAVLHRSTDGGLTFDAQPGSPRIRALAERGGRLYAATDWTVEPHALITSSDDGRSWTGVMRFADVQRVRACPVTPGCLAVCQTLVAQGVLKASVCGAAPAGQPPGVVDPERLPGTGPPPGRPQPPASGSGCAFGGGSARPAVCAALVLWLATALLGRRRRRP